MARKVKAKDAAAQTEAEPMPAAARVTEIGSLPPSETIAVRSHRVACDGVGGALGHPRVWMEMGEGAFVECPYCDRRFVLATHRLHDENERTAPGVYEGSSGH